MRGAAQVMEPQHEWKMENDQMEMRLKMLDLFEETPRGGVLIVVLGWQSPQ